MSDEVKAALDKIFKELDEMSDEEFTALLQEHSEGDLYQTLIDAESKYGPLFDYLKKDE